MRFYGKKINKIKEEVAISKIVENSLRETNREVTKDMLKKKVLILSFSNIQNDPRVMRQIDALIGDYDLTVCGYGEQPHPRVNFIQLKQYRHPITLTAKRCLLLITKQYDHFYWTACTNTNAFNRLNTLCFDLVIANDLSSAPCAARLNQVKSIIDLHEYSLDQSASFINKILLKKYFLFIAKKYLPKFDSYITVCEGINNLYKNRLGFDCLIITNAPNYENLSPSPININQIRLLHHGVASPERKILELIEVLKLLDSRFVLDLVLVGDRQSSYFKKIFIAIKGYEKRIKVLDPFPMLDIAKNANKYDLGVCMLSTSSESKRLALPNKLFEWIQARIGVVTWPLPEMQKVIEKYNIGKISNDCSIESMAITLNLLTTEQIETFKKNTDSAAKELNSNKGVKDIRELVKRLIV